VMGLCSSSLERIEPSRRPEFMAFHGLKIRASSVPLSRLSPLLLGAKSRGKQLSKTQRKAVQQKTDSGLLIMVLAYGKQPHFQL